MGGTFDLSLCADSRCAPLRPPPSTSLLAWARLCRLGGHMRARSLFCQLTCSSWELKGGISSRILEPRREVQAQLRSSSATTSDTNVWSPSGSGSWSRSLHQMAVSTEA